MVQYFRRSFLPCPNPVRPNDCYAVGYAVGVVRDGGPDWAWRRDNGDRLGRRETCELAVSDLSAAATATTRVDREARRVSQPVFSTWQYEPPTRRRQPSRGSKSESSPPSATSACAPSTTRSACR